MQLLKDYRDSISNLQKYFGCTVFDFSDHTDDFWVIRNGKVYFDEDPFLDHECCRYCHEVYLEWDDDEIGKHLELYTRDNYTMIHINDGCGGDHYSVFDNKYRVVL
jgi:hypothetical protein